MNARVDTFPGEHLPWSERNQQWLTLALASLCARLDRLAADDAASPPTDGNDLPAPGPDFEPALDQCAALFGLSPFERELLLLAAGVELDNALRHSVVRAHERIFEGSRLAQPTFTLALAMLAQPHWDALSPQAPLRRWKLLEPEGRRALARQPLHADERVLHFLTGVAGFDERLFGVAQLTAPAQPNASGTIAALAQRIARELGRDDARVPLVVLTQDRADVECLRAAAQEVMAATASLGLWTLAHDLPGDAAGLAQTALLIDREAALAGALPVIEMEPCANADVEHTHDERHCATLLAHLSSPALLLGPIDPVRLARLSHRRIVRVRVPDAQDHEPDLRDAATARALRRALQQFRLPASALHSVLAEVALDDDHAEDLDRRVWDACRNAARGGLDALAQRVDSQARFDDLVLPPIQAQLLREIAGHLRHRATVYETWGMGGRTRRGQGLCVLFAGESGTGKTLAAEAIANEAALDLYRIDLATVVSKYIGETEKNLRRVFDAAEASGAVLLFDEADALYGKRSDVKDSHDRYANIEVAYLLQRVEAYRGLAILTTNFRSALDRAFLRRIRFVVQFPFPDEAAREQIWQRELPASAPLHDVDFAALARLQLSGGHIRSVALNAAFIAAGAGESISMAHLRHAAQREAAKLERPLTEAAQKGW
ncbi:ATP-dependent zinc metalloprotease FtsH [Cupriavidus laharis]|uniref:ATP-dependent zinc metalloprotease FtsH n=1 Tax=Cupriavidus laharis TaxID=151654 RepID=A0ABM8WRS3_9BURK|nr:ATP-binding protein [Cupriavidus laharis]CAG9170147.1 ATP-dependent zinc metalloprotease FtsH [Cupriavidus laharis]